MGWNRKIRRFRRKISKITKAGCNRDLGLFDVLVRQAADVLERVREVLRDSEKRFRKLLETSTQAVWETDSRGMAVVGSPSWREFTGQTLAEWSGRGWIKAIHPHDREARHPLETPRECETQIKSTATDHKHHARSRSDRHSTG